MGTKINHDYLIGQKFGKLLILSWKVINKRPKAECLCECGNIKFMRIDILYKRKSCGCTPPIPITGEKCNLYVDGRAKDKLYNVWCAIKNRVDNYNCKQYIYYGARGIKMCNQWYDYAIFKVWAINNGYKEKLTIERKNNNGDYEPNNCKWVTMKEQCQNRRNSVFITYLGESKTLRQWCDTLKLNYNREKWKMYRHREKTGGYKLSIQ